MLHRHAREDEYSFVLEGSVGALLGDEVLVGKPGDLIFKPRNQWHTFWNAGETPARILEIISPAGFEQFFRELDELGGVTNVEPATMGALCQRYALEMKPESVPELLGRFGLRFPGERVSCWLLVADRKAIQSLRLRLHSGLRQSGSAARGG